MQDLTLVIPAKYESESLPIFLNEIANLDCKKLIVLESEDTKTIKSINAFVGIELLFQTAPRLHNSAEISFRTEG